jgi:hypothetical protein
MSALLTGAKAGHCRPVLIHRLSARLALPCCRKDFVEAPSLEEIIHYDQWARLHVKENVERRAAVAV